MFLLAVGENLHKEVQNSWILYTNTILKSCEPVEIYYRTTFLTLDDDMSLRNDGKTMLETAAYYCKPEKRWCDAKESKIDPISSSNQSLQSPWEVVLGDESPQYAELLEDFGRRLELGFLACFSANL